jgi:hypothetical protein
MTGTNELVFDPMIPSAFDGLRESVRAVRD